MTACVEQLVREAQGGDQRAFGRLVAQCWPGALAAAQAVLRDRHLAEDAVQDAMIAAWSALRRLEQPAAFAHWLNTIVARRCYRILRSPDMMLVHHLPDTAISGGPSPVEAATARECNESVSACIDELAEDLIGVARLYYVRQCSQREVAAFLGLPVTTVNNRLHIIRRTLRERILDMPKVDAPRRAAPPKDARVGRIEALDGPLIRVRFESTEPVDLFDALAQADESGEAIETMKVVHRCRDGSAICLATGPEDGVKPGARVMNTGACGIGVKPWTGVPPIAEPVFRAAVAALIASRPTDAPLIETGIKVIDLFCPVVAGAALAIRSAPGVGRIVLVDELIRRLSGREQSVNLLPLVDRTDCDSVRGMLFPGDTYSGDDVGTVRTYWLIAERVYEHDVANSLNCFDAMVYCGPIQATHGIWPAIDPLLCWSKALAADVVGPRHVELVARAKQLLADGADLLADPVMLRHLACRSWQQARRRAAEFVPQRLEELAGEQRRIAERSRRLEAFLSQPFYVAEEFTGIPGRHVALAETLDGCEAIMAGECDDRSEKTLRFIGSLNEARP